MRGNCYTWLHPQHAMVLCVRLVICSEMYGVCVWGGEPCELPVPYASH